MARSDTITMIPLDRVAKHLQINPWHFNGISSDYIQLNYTCEDLWYQYGYQSSGRLSLDDLAFALKQAETVVSNILRWTPIPQWVEEEVAIPDYYKTEVNNWVNSRLQPKSVQGTWGYITALGAKTSSYIDTPSTVFSDADGDGLDDTVTISFATSVTDEEELHVYYPDKSGREEWEIKDLTSISISAGTATIVFPKYLIPLQVLVEAMPDDAEPKIPIDGDDNTNFLTEVDVYRIYADPSQQVTFYYSPDIGCNTTPCEESTDTGCLFVKNRELSILNYQRSDWDEDTETYIRKYFTYQPVKAKIYYKAGWRDIKLAYPDNQMDRNLERMISFYALSLLDTELCGCDNTRKIWQYQTRDLALVQERQSYTVQWDDLRNPLGTSFAALRLWKYIQYIRNASSQVMA